MQELLNDVHCIIEAMIGRGSDVALRKPEMQDIPHVLLGDPDRVRGILLNLSTNAAKFTKKGHITMKVMQTHCPAVESCSANNLHLQIICYLPLWWQLTGRGPTFLCLLDCTVSSGA